MDEDMLDEANPYEIRDRFARLILGTIAGFAAKEMTERAYDAFVTYRRNR